MKKDQSRTRTRCAIYTRKSTEEGLDQDFNSLDAQREACEAYVLSQKQEGWIFLPDRYDDGGFSGGSIERPALQRLLGDIAEGRIDVVIVYKVDRLTRALADFAKIVDIFDGAGVSFVSVTQAFNTTTSMGRLTLNVLLSFAQFEREVTAERIRDKIAASKKKGMWMGGVVPLGYSVKERKLLPEPKEAALVRLIFERYLTLGSVGRVKAALDRDGISTPERLHRAGGRSGGSAFSRGKLYAMLANPIYVGRITHRNLVYPGQHAPILEIELWQAVQDQLAANRRERSLRRGASSFSPLAGRLFDPDGEMRTSHAQKNDRRYRYYVSADLVANGVAAGATGWRVPAGEIEAVVAHAIAVKLQDSSLVSGLLLTSQVQDDVARELVDRIAEIVSHLHAPSSRSGREMLRQLVTRVDLSDGRLRAEAAFANLAGATSNREVDRYFSDAPSIAIDASIQMRRRGAELRIVLQGAAVPQSAPDVHLVRTLIEARACVADYVDPEQDLTVSSIAKRNGADAGDVSRSLQLAFLAPDIVTEVLDGAQPVSLTAQRLKRVGELPLLWDEQRELLG